MYEDLMGEEEADDEAVDDVPVVPMDDNIEVENRG
jgi:hypothetical protein